MSAFDETNVLGGIAESNSFNVIMFASQGCLIGIAKNYLGLFSSNF